MDRVKYKLVVCRIIINQSIKINDRKIPSGFPFLAFSDLIDFQKASTLQTKPNTYCDYLD